MISLKYKIKRFRVWLGEKIRKVGPADPNASNSQEKAIKIVSRLIGDSDSELLIAPISGKFYVKNLKKDLYVILERGSVSVINGKYHYDVTVSDTRFDHLYQLFRNRVERDRLKMEREIRSKIEKSLDQILSDHFPDKGI